MSSQVKYDRFQPFAAPLVSCSCLTKKGSSKEILHIVCDLSNSDIVYSVGSSFGLLPENLPQFVDEVLTPLGKPYGKFLVRMKTGETVQFDEFLTKHANLSRVTKNHAELVQKQTGKIAENLNEYNLATFLTAFWHASIPLQELVDITPPMLPRYYSIASSMKAVGHE